MRNAMFFPNRIRYTARLLRVTTTYSVDLTLDEFLHLKILFPIEEIGTRQGDRLKTIAQKIVQRYGSGLGDNEHLRKSAEIANAFDYNKFGEITIGGYMPGEDGGYTIADGNHRSIALATLLRSGAVEYQPVTAILAVSKDITEDVVYEDEASVSR